MSYCRWGSDSDVYVFEVEDGIECCRCAFMPTGTRSVIVPTPTDMLIHLGEHITAGHKVPAEAITQLEAET